ncbi:MAG TPA: 50S ribosomal protein L5 [Rectinemataceae bacterium]|nr:50S ribosomal protein L5 [Rectinemataceae bacterium]
MADDKVKAEGVAKAKAEGLAKAKAKADAKAKAEPKAKGEPKVAEVATPPRLKKIYKEKIAPELFKEMGYESFMQVPRLVKVIVSMGVGEAKENKKLLDAAVADLGIITGQHAVKTKARKSIATFKIRQGQEIGCRVTLRGNYMWEFLDRLMNVALPRVKDFRGVNANAFDGHGNYSLGLNEQIIFPEIDFDKIEKVMGLNIAIVTTAKTDREAKSLLGMLGMPFRK